MVSIGLFPALVVTVPPVLFLIILFGGGFLSLRNNINQDGDPPIHKTLFYTSKYSVIILWAVVILQVWGIQISLVQVPPLLVWISFALWFFGFAFLYYGRFKLGESFRLGIPKESTGLMTNGLFRFSRNPMYLGLYATVLASCLYTLNPVVILLGGYVIVVHHKIILAEEGYMKKVFGQEYVDYCHRVRRYI
jgi:protein-S-isoprenylcysteine O-methyltransferase Ste14